MGSNRWIKTGLTEESKRRNRMIIGHMQMHGVCYVDEISGAIPMDIAWLRQGLSYLEKHQVVQKGGPRGLNKEGLHPASRRWRLKPGWRDTAIGKEFLSGQQ